MKIFLEKKNKGYLELGIIFGALTLGGLTVLRLAGVYVTQLPGCTFHNITGIPCPSCGATRSAVLLAHGAFYDALKMNPLFFICYLSSLGWGLISLALCVPKKKISITISYFEARFIRWGALIIILLNWTYLIIANALGFCEI